MKTLFTYTSLLIVATILFTSCSQEWNTSITKRHYRKGYYAHKPTTVTPKDREVAQEGQSVFHSPQITKAVAEDNTVASKNYIAPVTNNHSSGTKVADNNSNFESVPTASPVINLKINSTKEFLKNKSIYKKISKHSDQDARSFFWTIILVVLILWLIAYLSGGWGLGGLINLLLVVALILFILWLLRLI